MSVPARPTPALQVHMQSSDAEATRSQQFHERVSLSVEDAADVHTMRPIEKKSCYHPYPQIHIPVQIVRFPIEPQLFLKGIQNLFIVIGARDLYIADNNLKDLLAFMARYFEVRGHGRPATTNYRSSACGKYTLDKQANKTIGCVDEFAQI